jgi:hypothetical protein
MMDRRLDELALDRLAADDCCDRSRCVLPQAAAACGCGQSGLQVVGCDTAAVRLNLALLEVLED